jgi:AAA+ ATPase superfamily predicted ATPase
VNTASASLPKPADVLDRDREWDLLAESLESDGPNLVLVLGRRRAGKSYLLTRFARAAGGLYYQATRKTEREQLLALSRALGEQFDDAALRRVALPDWDAVLGYIADRAAGEPFLLVLDEFPYIADSAPALPSILQQWWDHQLAGTRISIVLSGSHISAMKRLVDADQPLYGRRTGRIDIRPFDYLDAARFVPEWPARDKLLLYAIFGGLPGHLALVDPAHPLAQNAARHLLSSSGRLYDEAAHTFDAFLADAGVHYSIIEAIAGGEEKWNRISSRIGKQTSALARPLDWLSEMEVVDRVAPITEYPKPNPKRTLYRLTDPYLTFWHRFVADIKERGLAALVEPERLWAQFVAPRLNDHAGPIFEEACRQFVSRGRHPILPFRPIEVGSWWNADSSEEVDIVAIDGAGGLAVGECKWGPIEGRDLETLRRRGRLVAAELESRAGVIERVTHILFSAGGLEGVSKTTLGVDSGDVLHVPIETLYEEPGS